MIYWNLSLELLLICNYDSNSLSWTFITLIIFSSSSYSSLYYPYHCKLPLFSLAAGSHWLFLCPVAWCLRSEGVSSVLLGVSTTDQLLENLGALRVHFLKCFCLSPKYLLFFSFLTNISDCNRIHVFHFLLLRFCPKWPLKRSQRLMPCWETSHTQRKSCVHENNDISDGWHLKKTDGDSDIGKHRFFALLYTQQLACPQQHYASSKRA